MGFTSEHQSTYFRAADTPPSIQGFSYSVRESHEGLSTLSTVASDLLCGCSSIVQAAVRIVILGVLTSSVEFQILWSIVRSVAILVMDNTVYRN